MIVVVDGLPSIGSSTVLDHLEMNTGVKLARINAKEIWRDTAYSIEHSGQLYEILGAPVIDLEGVRDDGLIDDLLFSPKYDAEVCRERRHALRVQFFRPFVASLLTKIYVEFQKLYPERMIVIEHCFALDRMDVLRLLTAINPDVVVSLQCPKEIRILREIGKRSGSYSNKRLAPLKIRLNILNSFHSDEEHRERAKIFAMQWSTYVFDSSVEFGYKFGRAIADLHDYLLEQNKPLTTT
jgi:hypothetical protein